MSETSLSKLAAWKKLSTHLTDFQTTRLDELFTHDPLRFDQLSLNQEGFLLDYSKNKLNFETIKLLIELAKENNLEAHIHALFSGEIVNESEGRRVLHTALRNRNNTPIMVDGKNIVESVNAVLTSMRDISERVRQGIWRGFSGKTMTDIVNIGIGGSDLGPKMATYALNNQTSKLRCHFVSNVDGTAIARVLKEVNPETTLFIIASKTFTTIETLANAKAAKEWFLQFAEPNEVNKHFIALSSAVDKATDWGIDSNNILPLWDWVGGRYSLWSAIGLPIAIMIGMDQFEEMLDGASSMDQHFKNTSFEKNLPIILGLIGIWNSNFLGYSSQAILPYCEALKFFPDHLQQLEMESNGKTTNVDGETITDYSTCPVIWGSVGTNGQHSFHQLLHQGSAKVCCDFILPITPLDPIDHQHEILAANCFAQSQALMCGRTETQAYEELVSQGMSDEEAKKLAPHKIITGDKPSTTLLFKQLNPYSLGQLIALYEHKVMVQGCLWRINSFDQWGVELGKSLAKNILSDFSENKTNEQHDSSTKGLIKHFLTD